MPGPARRSPKGKYCQGKYRKVYETRSNADSQASKKITHTSLVSMLHSTGMFPSSVCVERKVHLIGAAPDEYPSVQALQLPYGSASALRVLECDCRPLVFGDCEAVVRPRGQSEQIFIGHVGSNWLGEQSRRMPSRLVCELQQRACVELEVHRAPTLATALSSSAGGPT